MVLVRQTETLQVVFAWNARKMRHLFGARTSQFVVGNVPRRGVELSRQILFGDRVLGILVDAVH